MSQSRSHPRLRYKKTSSHSFFKKPVDFHPMMFQNPGYENGDTLLHIAVRKRPTIEGVDELIQKIGLEVVTAMSVMTNDHGKLPIHLINPYIIYLSSITQDDLDNLRKKLLALMNNFHIKKLHEQLTNHEVELELNSQNSRLINNLKIGAYISNAARKIILESGTHPQLNDYDKTKQDEILNQVHQMRTQTDNAPISTDKVENVTHYTSEYKTGNCHEFSYLALGILRKIDPGLNGDVFTIRRGDHVFLVIDRDPNSDPANPATWGEHAVVCDSWSGAVYPAAEIPFKLKNFSYYILQDKSRLNVISSFNPRFHELACEYSIFPKGKTPHQSPEFKRLILKRSSSALEYDNDEEATTEEHSSKRIKATTSKR